MRFGKPTASDPLIGTEVAAWSHQLGQSLDAVQAARSGREDAESSDFLDALCLVERALMSGTQALSSMRNRPAVR